MKIIRNDGDNELALEVSRNLRRFNFEVVGRYEIVPIRYYAVDEKGDVIGGAIGEMLLGWLHVDWLWVHENHRKSGIGTTLMRAIESGAKEMGAHHAFLDTVSVQAPGFYLKLGYTEHGRIKNFCKDVSGAWTDRIDFSKPL